MVTKDDACWIIGLSAGAGIGVYLDGGWGVDALVGRETRAHNDIDLFVQRGDYQRFVDLIADEGFPRWLHLSPPKITRCGKTRRGASSTFIASISPRMAIFCIRRSFSGEVFSGRGRIGEVEVSCIDPEKPAVVSLGLSA